MESLQRKQQSSASLSESASKKGLGSSDGFNNSKKGFISQLFTKKKPAANNDMEMQSRPNEADPKPKGKIKQKLVNRKNITDGRIRLNVVDNDRVPEDYLIDYKDNPFDILDLNPSRTTSYIENLKSREFSQINNREVKRFVESQQNKDNGPPLQAENLETDLLELSKSFEGFLAKFFRFFQGLLPGFCIIHLFLIFAGSDTQTILSSYALTALRVYQIFQVVALICTIGALNRYIETKSKYVDAVRSHPQVKDSLNNQLVKYGLASLMFFITYALIIFNHEFVSKISDVASSVDANDFTTSFSIFRVLSVIMAVASIIGWFTLILAFEEISKYQMDSINYSDLTGDESMEDDA
jgi:hypothetical protein